MRVRKQASEPLQRRECAHEVFVERRTNNQGKPDMKTKLDQFYTKPDIAKECWDLLHSAIEVSEETTYIEPSAGEGSFFRLMPHNRRTGCDLEPKCEEVEQRDFLKGWRPKGKKPFVAVGNPPFGHRAKTALQFVNKCARYADTVAMILPATFSKYSVQKHLPQDMRLIASLNLDNAFYRADGNPYSVNSVFQVWTRKETEHRDLRLRTPPPTSHPDFEMWQYNNTREALKVFDETFDFAVPRQGYEDYGRRETNESDCERKKQWILFKGKNPQITNRLINMDFEKLSQLNTVTPGFGKADVVEAYRRLYETC